MSSNKNPSTGRKIIGTINCIILLFIAGKLFGALGVIFLIVALLILGLIIERRAGQNESGQQKVSRSLFADNSAHENETTITNILNNLKTHVTVKYGPEALDLLESNRIDLRGPIERYYQRRGLEGCLSFALDYVAEKLDDLISIEEPDEEVEIYSDDDNLEHHAKVVRLSEKIRANSFSINFKELLDQCHHISIDDVLEYPSEVSGRSVFEHIAQPKSVTSIFNECYLSEQFSLPLNLLDMSVVDVETTGLGSFDEVIEIAAIRFNIHGKVIDAFQHRVKPGVAISSSAAATHGIRLSDLDNEPSFEDVWPQVRQVLDGSVVFAHNGPFDVRLIEQSLRGIAPRSSLNFVDTLLSYRLFTETKSNLYKLETLSRGLGIQAPGYQHNALNDCLQTASLVLALATAKPNLGLTRADTNIDSLEPRQAVSFNRDIYPDKLQIPHLGFTRGPFQHVQELNKFKFKFSLKGVRFYVDDSVNGVFDQVVDKFLDHGLESAKRLTPTVKYIFASPSSATDFMAKNPGAILISSLGSAEGILSNIKELYKVERELALSKYLNEQERAARRRWDRAENHCPTLREESLDPIQYVDKFYYKRWE